MNSTGVSALDLEIENVNTVLRRISQKRPITEHTNLLCVQYKDCTGCPIARLTRIYDQQFCAGNKHIVEIDVPSTDLVPMFVNYKVLLVDAQENDDKSIKFNNDLLENWYQLYPEERPQ